jgi:Transcriptional Coactivator p15 (PC4)
MPTLPEPIEAAKFFCNRRSEAVIVALREYEGVIIVDARRHYTAADGTFKPTKKGLAIVVRRLPDLARAINKAHKIAVELGLINNEAGHG